ncbi:MAG TPA: phosphodiester glycosidase family protein [Longimicrobium sp.]|nr:phosphodiester glycosidase family protein [Longimicrobium sp.]
MSRSAAWIAVVVSLAALLAAGALVRIPVPPRANPQPAAVTCRQQTIAGARYRVCEIPASRLGRLQLAARDDGGRPVRTIARVDSLVRARGERLLFATNAGLYERVDSATGMLVADGGRTYSRLNRGAGPPNPCAVANFYCPPNGVFFVVGGTAGVLSTNDFARRRTDVGVLRIATQSGPMLVRRGELARAFPPDSRSRLVRNGVGVRADGTVVFAIADGGVSFHQFATAFRDALRCPDALFLDGTISQLHAGPGSRLPPPSREFAAVFTVTEAAARR